MLFPVLRSSIDVNSPDELLEDSMQVSEYDYVDFITKIPHEFNFACELSLLSSYGKLPSHMLRQ